MMNYRLFGMTAPAALFGLILYAAETPTAKSPVEGRFVDAHVHFHHINESDMDKVAEWMEQHDIRRVINHCEKVGLPVMFHMDQDKNLDGKGLPGVRKALEVYPKLFPLKEYGCELLEMMDGTKTVFAPTGLPHTSPGRNPGNRTIHFHGQGERQDYPM